MTEPYKRREVANLVCDTSTDRYFMREIETKRYHDVVCWLRYSYLEKFEGWVIEVVAEKGHSSLFNPPIWWIDPIGMISSEASRFDIPEDTRQLLNKGLVFLNENAPPPTIRDGEVDAPPNIYKLEVIEDAIEYADLFDRVDPDMYDRVDPDLMPDSKYQEG